MRKIGILLAVLAACSSGPRLPRTADGAPVLSVGGAVERGPFALGRNDLAKLPRRSVRGVDPVSGRVATWEGISLDELVSRRVEIHKGADTILVRTADRAAIAIPLTLVRQQKPVLADHADGARISPSVLAWPTLELRGLETDPRASLWWARDVVALELVDWQRTFAAALVTPDGAPDGARRGSAFYGERCIACHRMRGVGGERGPDLTGAAARISLAPFARLLEQHPGWKGAGGDPPGAEGAGEVWSFLDAVGKAGPASAPPTAAAQRSTASSAGAP